MRNTNSDFCIHYELLRSDFPSFKDKAFSKATLIRRAKKHWSNCTITIVKVKNFRGRDGSILEHPVSYDLISI